MPKPEPSLTNKAIWIIVAVVACGLGWQQYRAWQRYKLSLELEQIVAACESPSAIPGDKNTCDPRAARSLLARGANVHYAPNSDNPSLFLQTQWFLPEWPRSATTPQAALTSQQQQRQQYEVRMRPLREAVANALLDAWLVDHAHHVKLPATQEKQETTQACRLALNLNRPELIAPLLDSHAPLDKNEMLLHAISNAQLGAVQTLVEHGAALEHTTSQIDSALEYACISGKDSPGKMAIIRYLLDKGADVNHLDRSHYSVLQAAAGYGSETVALLLAHGAKVNTQDVFGGTALMLAASRGDAVSVKLLLAHGADPNLRTKQGATALSRAIRYKHGEVARQLQQAGAKE